MRILSLFLILISFNSYALEIQEYNFSFMFGSANLSNPDGEQTYGSGATIRAEGFVEQNWGLVGSLGSYYTENDTFDATETDFTYNTIFMEAGAFLYFAEYFRVAGGLGIGSISETKKTPTQKFNNEYTELGPFAQIGFKYPYRSVVFGVDYVYQSYKDFTQRGFFFMLGLLL